MSEWYSQRLSKQIVNNPTRILQYMKGRGELVLVGNELQDLYRIVSSRPSLQSEDCCNHLGNRREQANNKIQLKLGNRKSNEIWRRGTTHPEEIFRKFTADEAVEVNALMGMKCYEMAKKYIRFRNEELLPNMNSRAQYCFPNGQGRLKEDVRVSCNKLRNLLERRLQIIYVLPLVLLNTYLVPSSSLIALARTSLFHPFLF